MALKKRDERRRKEEMNRHLQAKIIIAAFWGFAGFCVTQHLWKRFNLAAYFSCGYTYITLQTPSG